MSKKTSDPAKKQKVDEEYEPLGEADSGSSSVELYSDELEGDEVDLAAYLRERDRLIAEEQAEEQASESSDSEENSEGASESEGESSEPPPRSKRRHSASSSE